MAPSRNKSGNPQRRDERAGTGRRDWRYPAVAVGVTVVVVVALVFLIIQRDSGVGPDPQRVAELEEAENERHVEQVGELIDLTQQIHDELLPVLAGLDEALPEDEDTTGEPADPDDVEEWAEIVADLATEFETAPSGATDHNIARNGLRTSVDLFDSAVGVYAIALDTDDDPRPELEEHAASLRTQAVRAWSVSATQLDALAIDAGYGHVHIYLPADPASGALQADGHPEGAEAAEPVDPTEGHDH